MFNGKNPRNLVLDQQHCTAELKQMKTSEPRGSRESMDHSATLQLYIEWEDTPLSNDVSAGTYSRCSPAGMVICTPTLVVWLLKTKYECTAVQLFSLN